MRIPIRFTFFDKNDESYHKIANFPSNWGDLTLGQLMQVQKIDPKKKKSKLKLFSIITGLTEAELDASTDLEYWKQVENILAFMYEAPDFKIFPVPNKVLIQEQEYKVPVDLKLETFGQKIALEELYRSHQTDEGADVNLIDLMPEALAIYFYPMLTGEKFDDEQVDQYTELMKEIPVKHALPVAGFFLSSCTLS